MKKIQIDTLIVGAGPAGMAAALELSAAGKEFILVEKNSKVGGLAKTYSFTEGKDVFYTDNGPHRFFSKNPYLYEMIGGLLGEKWILVKRQTRQYIDGKFYDYPVNAVQAMKNLGAWKAFRMGIDYIFAKLQYLLLEKKIKNFEDYVVANFGRTLGEFNMINYTEKIWGIPANEIHADWAKQRIKGLSLTTLLKDALTRLFGGISADKPKTLVDTFYYPDGGTGLIYETIRKRLEEKGYSVFLNSKLKQIKNKGGILTQAIIETSEGDIEVSFSNLIESIPPYQFIETMENNAPREVREALKSLSYRHQIYLFVTLDKPQVTKDQWIYFPAKEVPFGRISEMKNFSAKMSPEGKTSLFIEFFCFEDDPVWGMNAEELLDYSLPYLEESKLISRKDVRSTYIIKEQNVYPIYNLDYERPLGIVKDYLNGFKNLYYVGRPGRFRYNNQDHSLEMGIAAARSIIEGIYTDMDTIGGEKEYYESGHLKDKSTVE